MYIPRRAKIIKIPKIDIRCLIFQDIVRLNRRKIIILQRIHIEKEKCSNKDKSPSYTVRMIYFKLHEKKEFYNNTN